MTDVLTVERLTFGFDALAHRDRRVVFVPYAAPGDRVTAEIVESRADFTRARIVEVLEPGPARVLPGCRHFPTCGGCQWQHIAPAAQRDAKAAIVAEQLARSAGVRDAEVLPTLTTGDDWHYRARITLVVEGRRAGYHRARSHRLVEVDACPLAEPVLSAHLDAARRWIAALRVPLRRVALAVAPGGVVLTGVTAAAAGARDAEATEALLARTPTVRGAVLADPAGRGRLVVGDPRLRVALEPGLDLEVPADVFTQVNPAANRLLVAAVMALGGFVPGERVLDLYAGAGNFTLPVARRGTRVTGIERNPIAAAAGRENAARLGLRDVTFETAPVVAALARRAPETADVVVLDPPRAGAADAIPALGALRARRIVYVSCDAATLARDVRLLAAHGYRVARVQPIDLFPQTFHVETVTLLLLT
ncbi:MAG: 23S rRNA (uracil(1939)-C(5))-methyltransferase RlmD [Deltaproteobacteria bacterium]|nr:MAG: 23S rRNA (uracil(1939)-C(5))-methyltransferase RlmD [Deltaproteobacteria bacterium]